MKKNDYDQYMLDMIDIAIKTADERKLDRIEAATVLANASSAMLTAGLPTEMRLPIHKKATFFTEKLMKFFLKETNKMNESILVFMIGTSIFNHTCQNMMLSDIKKLGNKK